MHDDPARTAELARSLDDRMNVYPWRHPQGPVPVRPVLLDRWRARGITWAAMEVVRLAAAECARRASSPAELCALLGIPVSPMLTDRDSWNRWALDQARPDVVLTGGVPKVLECNISGAIGGIEQTARLDSCFWNWPGVRGLTHRHRLWGGHTIAARRQLLLDIARSRGTDRPQVAIAGWSEANFSETMIDAASHGAPCIFVTQEELTEDDGLRNAHGLRIDVLLQKFVTADSYAKGEPMAALEAAVARDSTFIAAPEISTVYSDKKVLAWLTERAADLPPAQRRVIEDHVPWTSELTDRKVSRHGTEHDLLTLVENDQHAFVLKPTGGHSGHGVLIGRETEQAAWLAAVHNAVRDGHHVVQEFCEPDRFPTTVCDLASGEMDVLDVPHLISPMLVRGEGTGFLARFLPDPARSMITVRLGAQNTVFIHD
ncbi:hypothetical protein [Streptomyces sp. MMS24-I29]|uniref:hypothetical protein n=1 Tax=Streptomyces sp. MMS24-I29 TaxID=3351480 RepID=UPI003C7D7BAA